MVNQNARMHIEIFTSAIFFDFIAVVVLGVKFKALFIVRHYLLGKMIYSTKP